MALSNNSHSDSLSSVRAQHRRLAERVAHDPAAAAAAAVAVWLSQIMEDQLGWRPASRIAIDCAGFAPGTVEAYAWADPARPDLIVQGLDYLSPADDEACAAAAGALGARWLVQTNLQEWRLLDTANDLPPLVVRIGSEISMRALLSALTNDGETAQRLEQLAAVARVLSFEPLLLEHFVTQQRDVVVGALLAIAEDHDLRVDRPVAEAVLREAPLALDLLAETLMSVPKPQLASLLSSCGSQELDSRERRSASTADQAAATAPITSQGAKLPAVVSLLPGTPSAQDEYGTRHPLVYEQMLAWKTSCRRKGFDAAIRAFKLRDLAPAYELKAGSMVVPAISSDAEKLVKCARAHLEARTGLVNVYLDGVQYLRTTDDVIFHSLGALYAAVIGYHGKVHDSICKAGTRETISVADIEAAADAAEAAKAPRGSLLQTAA